MTDTQTLNRPDVPAPDPAPDAGPPKINRGHFLKGAAAAAVVGGGSFGISRLVRSEPPKVIPFGTTAATRVHRFRSVPSLRPPQVRVTGARPDELLMLGPGSNKRLTQQGPLIVDGAGQPVWFNPVAKDEWATNFTAGTLSGEPVLWWWEGKLVAPGFGQGQGVVVNSRYEVVARVLGQNGRLMDLHELTITPQGTALFTCYPETVTRDLRSVGGARDGKVLQSVIQEVDLHTGKLVMEWRSLEHVGIHESYRPVKALWDYLHVNSITVAPDGHLVISARNTWAIYKLHRSTGEILWRLGGKQSDYVMGEGTQFSWQHDARLQPGSQISVFDDGYDGRVKTEQQSRGMLLQVDHRRRSVRVAQEFKHPAALSSSAMGSMQVLSGDRVLVGWGSEPFETEFDGAGNVVNDTQLPDSLYSYRAFRTGWKGTPGGSPSIAVHRATKRARPVIYASWNGATEIHAWRVHAGPHPAQLKSVGQVRRTGFETAVQLGRDAKYVSVTALGRHGRALGTSAAVATRS